MTRRRQVDSQKQRNARLRIVFTSGKEIVTDPQPYTVQEMEKLHVTVSNGTPFAVSVGDEMVLVNSAHVEFIGVTFSGPTTTRSL